MQKYEDRILFLKHFTKELIIQSKPSEYEIEKQREEEIHLGEFIPSTIISEETEPTLLNPLLQLQKPIQTPIQITGKRLPLFPQKYKIKLTKPLTRPFVSSIYPELRAKIPSKQILPQIQPYPSPEQIDLGKLNIFTKDPRVTIIESPGPGKFVLAKTAGQITVTKISLTKEEIQEIIQKFSEKSKIPVISGLFKSAVGNLILTAVISDLVGSRFIITKMTPRLMLEQATNIQ